MQDVRKALLRNARHRKKLYERLRAEGRCTSCCKMKPPGMTEWWCKPCRDAKNIQSKQRYYARKAAGICVQCGMKSDRKVKCTGCYELNRMRKVKRDDSLADTIG